MTPKVTFIVPCYNLARFLAECVRSILDQTYTDFEVLIMDDCSADNTAEVARSFSDSRVTYVCNAENLGHLRNYNRGIDLARGEYIWLISADDLLWRRDALARYVEAMEEHPDASFGFCSAVELQDGQVHPAAYSVWQRSSGILNGQEVLNRLIYANTIVAASGFVRKSMYLRHGKFPLDLPYAGDWYLWCLFSMFGKVIYFAEPMVAYRIHGGSMTDALSVTKVRQCAQDDIMVQWSLLRKAQTANLPEVSALCLKAVAYEYARQILSKKYRSVTFQRPLADVEESIQAFSQSEQERRELAVLMHTSLGDLLSAEGRGGEAFTNYRLALLREPLRLQTWLKMLLSTTGRTGHDLRKAASRWRARWSDRTATMGSMGANEHGTG